MPGDMTGKCFLRTKKQEAFNPMLGLIYITVKVRQASYTVTVTLKCVWPAVGLRVFMKLYSMATH